jgi:hypothetical protein
MNVMEEWALGVVVAGAGALTLPTGILARKLGPGDKADDSGPLFGDRRDAAVIAHQVFLLRHRNSWAASRLTVRNPRDAQFQNEKEKTEMSPAAEVKTNPNPTPESANNERRGGAAVADLNPASLDGSLTPMELK